MCLAAGDRGGYRRACELLEKACERNKDFQGAATGLLFQLFLLGNRDDFNVSRYAPYGRVLQMQRAEQPRDHRRFFRLAAARFLLGDVTEMIRDLVKTAESNQGESEPKCCLLLALILHRAGRPDEARKWLDRATTWLKEQEDVYERLGWTTRVELQLLRKETERQLGDNRAGEAKTRK